MTLKVQHKRSAVASKAPLPADLEYGEIAVNYEKTDPALYIKDSDNVVRKIGTQPAATETAAGIVELATAAETTTGTDATRAVHPAGLKVELDKKATKTVTSDTAPANPADGDLWYDSVSGELYVWYDSDDAGAAVGTWVQANPQVTPKQATASVAGVDVKLWKKTGTLLEPETANTDINTEGNISATKSVAGGLACLVSNQSADPGAYAALQLQCQTNLWEFAAKSPAASNRPGWLGIAHGGVTQAAFTKEGALRVGVGDDFINVGNIYSASTGLVPCYTLRNTAALAVKCWHIDADPTNSLKITNNGGSGVFMADGSSSWGTLSDERAKDGLQPISNGLSKVATLRSVTGHYINDSSKKSQSFLIAQDVQAVLPEAVSPIDESGLLGLRYTDVIPLLVAALKEAKDKIETLETRITTLEARP